jgi:CspA family cold shock protein
MATSYRRLSKGVATEMFAKAQAIMRSHGIVSFFDSTKGFGFISAGNCGHVFVHASALESAGIRSLEKGDKVSFVLEHDRKGRKQAGQLEKVEAEPREPTVRS